jgi:hypothetical protein
LPPLSLSLNSLLTPLKATAKGYLVLRDSFKNKYIFKNKISIPQLIPKY